MSSFKQMLLVSALLFSYSVSALTLQEAENIAYKHSHIAKQAYLNSQSLNELAQAVGEYDDPKLNFGLFNLPTDDFSISQNPTTQFRVGIKQMLPRGKINSFKRAEKTSLSKAQKFKADNVLLQVLKKTRLSYLDLFNHSQKKLLLKASRINFVKLENLTEQKFANGFATQQAVINAKLQLSKIDDSILKTQDLIEQAQSELSLWVQEAAFNEISPIFPVLNSIENMAKEIYIQEYLPNHPAIEFTTALINSMEDKLSVSQEMKKPAWVVGVEYRKRFGHNPDLSDRSDMLAMTASVDLPLFKNKKQNKVVVANQYQIEAAEQVRLDMVRKFSTDYQRFSRKRTNLRQRLKHYQNSIVSKTYENSKARLQAYQNGNGDFTTLLIAENLKLDAEIEILNLKIQIQKATAQLLYLTENMEKWQ